MTRSRALLILCLLWAAIFLPALGSLEIKGEEGRRILPAIAMLDNGNWVLPHIGGRPYLSKPPLINWLIAASFEATGVRNEWTARLPSVLAVLALALATVLLAPSWLGLRTSFVAAVFLLTTASFIDKGRLAEIEPVYVALSGIATLWWLRAWRAKKSPWLAWPVAALLLGAAALTKGPAHLLFFYGVVIAACWAEDGARGLRRGLLSLPHLCALVLLAAIVAAWAVPYLKMTAQLDVAETWRSQSVGRVAGSFDVAGWALNIPRALTDLLPWVVFAPLLWRFDAQRAEAPLLRALRNVLPVLCGALLLVPGSLPRYIMPATPVFCLLLAAGITDAAPRWREVWRRFVPFCRSTAPEALAISSGALAGALMILFALVAVPRMRRAEDIRPVGQRVNALVPPSATLHAFHMGFQPALFYVRRRVAYCEEREQLPDPTPWLLIRADDRKGLSKTFLQSRVIEDLPGKGDRHLMLVSVNGRKNDE
jgi:4-amino-4-deoxy-L-arabinose transferase-like glycosyltransferase